MLIPMPSPRGTNREKLFIRAPAGRPLAAYDASEGLSQPLGQQLLLFLRDKLSAADYADLETLLATATNDDPVAPAMDARRGRHTQSAASFYERYPEAARITQVW